MANKIVFECDLCNKAFQHGPHLYEGHLLKLYGITICDSCWNSNHDGFAGHYDKKLLELLVKHGLPIPERNENGFLPRG